MPIRAIQLLLPALIPSWRFFDWIAPSPRIEFAVTPAMEAEPDCWQLLTNRPIRVPVASAVRRLFYNPKWNDQLYLVSCAERIAQSEDAHSVEQIFRRIESTLPAASTDRYVRFRLVFLTRADSASVTSQSVVREVRYVSAVRRCQPGGSLE